MATPSETLRTCTICGADKPTSEYYAKKGGWYYGYCKACAIAKNKARREGPERKRVLAQENASMKVIRAKTRDAVFAAYGGFKCACCGETEPKFLTLDHINNDGGEWRKRVLGARTHAGYHTYRWLLKNGCPSGIQVLCMNCQHGKLTNGGVCPHQRTSNDYPAREYGQATGSAAPLLKAG